MVFFCFVLSFFVLSSSCAGWKNLRGLQACQKALKLLFLCACMYFVRASKPNEDNSSDWNKDVFAAAIKQTYESEDTRNTTEIKRICVP